jgi:hypothetical protein
VNIFKFFVHQTVLSIIGIVNNCFLRDFIFEHFHINNQYIISLIKIPIGVIVLYLPIKLYVLLETKLRYKILIHLGAGIVGAIILALITIYIEM